MLNEKQPTIRIKKTTVEWLLDIVAILSFVAATIYIITQWSDLPNRVPTHYNFFGEPDAWGGKGTIWILLIIGTILWIGLTFLERYPHLFNYVKISKETAEQQYRNGKLMMNLLKNEMAIYFAYETWSSIQHAHGLIPPFNSWSLALFILIVLSTLAIFIIRSVRIG